MSPRCGHKRKETTSEQATRMPCAWWTYSIETDTVWSKSMCGVPPREPGGLGCGTSAPIDARPDSASRTSAQADVPQSGSAAMGVCNGPRLTVE
jgi:hypothetical protein